MTRASYGRFVLLLILTTLFHVAGPALSVGATGQTRTREEPRQRRTGKAGSVVEGFELSARVDGKDTFASGEPIQLVVTLSNTTGQARPFFISTPELDYMLDLKNDRGEPVPLSRFGRDLFDSGFASHGETGLEAGEEQHWQIELTKLYDLPNPGAYTVTARRRVPKPDRKSQVEVTSGAVSFRIE